MSNSNAVEVHQDKGIQKPVGGPVTDVSTFANLLDTSKFEHMYRVAKVFASSQLVPQHFQDNVADCFVAVQMAVRMDVDPFMFMQNTYVLHGRPGMEAKLAIALVNKSGVLAGPMQYEVDGDDPKDQGYRVRAYGTVAATGEVVHGPWIDWEMVKAEGWLSKKGSKWQTMPAMMFQYRAATFFARLYAPEALMGMYTKDELEDMGVRANVTPSRRGANALNEALGRPAITAADIDDAVEAPGEPQDAREDEPDANHGSGGDRHTAGDAAASDNVPWQEKHPPSSMTPEEREEYGLDNDNQKTLL